jgi:hypothetical protein
MPEQNSNRQYTTTTGSYPTLLIFYVLSKISALVVLKLIIRPIDQGEPIITIAPPGED